MAESKSEVTIFNNFTTGRIVKLHHHKPPFTYPYNVTQDKPQMIELSSTEPGNKEYLLISLDHPPGEVPACKVTLKPVDSEKRADCTFIPSGTTNLHISHLGDETILRIPGRIPEWKLKVANPIKRRGGPSVLESQNVTLQEDEPVDKD